MKKNILLALITGAALAGYNAAYATSPANGKLPTDTSSLDVSIKSAIAKVYPACVFLADYDTITKSRNGMRFSGVVVRKDGLIMTAAHVCHPHKIYQVIFPDGRQCTARGLGRIGSVDAALMKIDSAGTYPCAEMGWSSSMHIGETCISIAYPGTFEHGQPVVRVGYVADTSSGRRVSRMRTTALMEPGDSGGPVFDLLGRVIGVCSSVTLPLDNNYEVPVDAFRKYWAALMKPVDYTSLPDTEPVPADPLYERTRQALLSDVTHHDALAKKMSGTCVRLQSKMRDSLSFAMGTIISVDRKKSFIISKSSVIGEQPVIRSDKRHIPLKVIARDSANDMVILEAGRRIKGGISRDRSFMSAVKFDDLGSMLVSVFPDTIASRASVVGSMELSLPRKASAGQLGVNVAAKNDTIFISSVATNTAASDARLMAGDKVISINGESFHSPESFSKGLVRYDPGDGITLVGMRNDSLFTINITLRKRIIEKHIANQFTDGRSSRRDGFAHAFIHDARIKPQECGGPVFDADGKFRGINIARTSRTSSVAIPAPAVWRFVDTVLHPSIDKLPKA